MDEATKTAHLVRPGAEDEANAVIVSIRNWNNHQCFATGFLQLT